MLYSKQMNDAMQNLASEKLKISEAIEISKVMNLISEDLKTFQEVSNNQITKYNGTKSDTGISFTTKQDEVEFNKSLDAYLDTELEIKPVDVHINSISPMSVFALQGIINFKGD
jgi:hypothetical protein